MDTKEPVNKINNELFADTNNRDCRDLLSEYVRHGDLQDFATHSEVHAVLNEVYSLTARSIANNGYIQESQLEPLKITPGTLYICTNAPANFDANKKIVGSTDPMQMEYARAQCVKFAIDIEYYNAVDDSPCTTVVADSADAYILCLETIYGARSILYTDNV